MAEKVIPNHCLRGQIRRMLAGVPLQNISQPIYEILRIFDVKDTDKDIGEHSIKAVDDALANKLPDLDLPIWTAISQIPDRFKDGPTYRDFDNAQIPNLTYDILKDTGLNMGAVLLLTLINQIIHGAAIKLSFKSLDGRTKPTMGITNFNFVSWIYITQHQISDDILWVASSLNLPPMPHTLAGLLEGKPLKSVISHPVFDSHPISIKRSYSSDTITYLDTDYRIAEHGRISLEELSKAELAKLHSI